MENRASVPRHHGCSGCHPLTLLWLHRRSDGRVVGGHEGRRDIDKCMGEQHSYMFRHHVPIRTMSETASLPSDTIDSIRSNWTVMQHDIPVVEEVDSGSRPRDLDEGVTSLGTGRVQVHHRLPRSLCSNRVARYRGCGLMDQECIRTPQM